MAKSKLEQIFWKKRSWMKGDGTKVTPEKIGDSFVVSSFRVPEVFDKVPEYVVEQLKEYKSSNYISKEQMQEINAYSIGKPIENNSLIKSSVSFYKVMEDKGYTHKEFKEALNFGVRFCVLKEKYGLLKNDPKTELSTLQDVKSDINEIVEKCNKHLPKSLIDEFGIKKIE